MESAGYIISSSISSECLTLFPPTQNNISGPAGPILSYTDYPLKVSESRRMQCELYLQNQSFG